MSRIWPALVLLVVSCGGKTGDDSGTGGGGTGGGSGTGAVSGSGGTSGCGPIDTGAACSTLRETECLAASSRCAPVYDDMCCPTCSPGGCADCMNWQFVRCIERELSSCVPGMVGGCGQTPSWACNGGTPSCDHDACNFVPGCYEALPTSCPPDALCASECHPITAGTCGPMCGPPIPIPACPEGYTQEYASGKLTGHCIQASACHGSGG
ncbi:MAG: hypothetical protein U0263_27175 [Polyangiaceae bacterium]